MDTFIRRIVPSEAVREISPGIIVGNTKTVEAVLLRRKLVSEGYRIFFGNSEVTPGNEQAKTVVHQTILNAYLFAKEFGVILPGNFFVYKGGISADLPQLDRYPESIQQAFEPLVTAQQKLGPEKTVMGPLLAIKSEILE